MATGSPIDRSVGSTVADLASGVGLQQPRRHGTVVTNHNWYTLPWRREAADSMAVKTRPRERLQNARAWAAGASGRCPCKLDALEIGRAQHGDRGLRLLRHGPDLSQLAVAPVAHRASASWSRAARSSPARAVPRVGARRHREDGGGRRPPAIANHVPVLPVGTHGTPVSVIEHSSGRRPSSVERRSGSDTGHAHAARDRAAPAVASSERHGRRAAARRRSRVRHFSAAAVTRRADALRTPPRSAAASAPST